MADLNQSNHGRAQSGYDDLEKGDHAVLPSGGALDATPASASQNSQEETDSASAKEDALSRRSTGVFDENDPFALFPALSISMSSTRGPAFDRRNTATTLTRPLTREETMQTLRTV